MAAGRFVDKKAPHLTLLAFRKVLEHFPDAELVIVGDGPLLPVCRDLVRYYRMDANVTLPGVVTPGEVCEQFSHCAAFVQHSVTGRNGDMEGTPVAVLEAAAAGLPVIATRHAGIPDVVCHGQTGLLVDEHDVDGMATAMQKDLDPFVAYCNQKRPRYNGQTPFKRVTRHGWASGDNYHCAYGVCSCLSG